MVNRNKPESNPDELPIDPTRERRPARECQYCPEADAPASCNVHVVMGSIDAIEPVCERHHRILEEAGFVSGHYGRIDD